MVDHAAVNHDVPLRPGRNPANRDPRPGTPSRRLASRRLAGRSTPASSWLSGRPTSWLASRLAQRRCSTGPASRRLLDRTLHWLASRLLCRFRCLARPGLPGLLLYSRHIVSYALFLNSLGRSAGLSDLACAAVVGQTLSPFSYFRTTSPFLLLRAAPVCDPILAKFCADLKEYPLG
jgi:hypothetical protein